MRIGDAAAAAGLTPRALRYYEQQGLISAARTPSGYREYGPREVRRLRAVRELLDAGLTIGDVRSFAHLLDTASVGETLPEHPGVGGPALCAAAETVIRRRLAELDERIVRLSELRDRLAERVGEPLRGLRASLGRGPDRAARTVMRTAAVRGAGRRVGG
ncbi:MerR family transcriptional regulator [Streptomyces zagrosensis]